MKNVAFALAAGAILSSPAMALDLTGQSVSASFALQVSASNIVPFTSPAVVGPGVEFTGGFRDVFGQDWSLALDVFATGFSLSWTGTDLGNLSGLAPEPFLFTLSGLSGIGPVSLVSYACEPAGQFPCTAFSGGPSLTSLTSDATSATVVLNVIRSGETYVFSLGNAGVIPEPATWAMLIAGFGLVGASLRRRRLALA